MPITQPTKVTSRDSGELFNDQSQSSASKNINSYSVASQSTDLGAAPDLTGYVQTQDLEPFGLGSKVDSGYSHTGAFADKPTSNNFVWESGAGINYTQNDVDSGLWKVMSLSRAAHNAVDNPYWSTPTPSGTTGVGLFQGANLPSGVSSLVDYDFVYNDNYDANGSTGFEGSTGRIKLNDCQYGDQLRVRFDFNVIPQIANTTIEPALWYSNRNDNDDITFTFPLTTSPVFYGTGSVGKTYLNRVDISAWITSNEDVNALTLPAIKSDNPVIIQPLGLLITIIR